MLKLAEPVDNLRGFRIRVFVLHAKCRRCGIHQEEVSVMFLQGTVHYRCPPCLSAQREVLYPQVVCKQWRVDLPKPPPRPTGSGGVLKALLIILGIFLLILMLTGLGEMIRAHKP